MRSSRAENPVNDCGRNPASTPAVSSAARTTSGAGTAFAIWSSRSRCVRSDGSKADGACATIAGARSRSLAMNLSLVSSRL